MNNNTAERFDCLPWETSTGFLWGFPGTVWALLKLSPASFNTACNGRAWKSLVFSCIICLIYRLPADLLFWYNFIAGNYVPNYADIGTYNTSLLEYYVFRLVVGPLYVLVTTSVIIYILSIIYHSLLTVFRQTRNLSFINTFNLTAYSAAFLLLILIPYAGRYWFAMWCFYYMVNGFVLCLKARPIIAVITVILVFCLFGIHQIFSDYLVLAYEECWFMAWLHLYR